jgi:predicted flavoprotein YhiN
MGVVDGQVIVVGAGPAGLLAAIAAARAGRRVTVCQRMPRAGAKLLASGGGRCNFTNTAAATDFAAAFGRQGRFVLPALEALDSAGLRRLLAELGVPSRVEDGFHVFPSSGRAGDVLAALLRECGRLGVEVRTSTPVEALLVDSGRVVGVRVPRSDLPAAGVILAAGGQGYPELGGTDAGYALARQAGHQIVPPVPALVPLVTAEKWPAACSGVSVPAARVRIDFAARPVAARLPSAVRPGPEGSSPKSGRASRGSPRAGAGEGDVLFTHTGLSGPAVLDLSGTVAELLPRQSAVPIVLELLPGRTAADWRREMDGWQRTDGRKGVRTLLARHVPLRLAAAICTQAGLADDARASDLPRPARAALERLLTALPLTVTATAGFARAMVTRGGVALKQVDPRTLASRLVAGLHFAGEVLDLDGPCGGYNLQWCMSSGWLAGTSVARR